MLILIVWIENLSKALPHDEIYIMEGDKLLRSVYQKDVLSVDGRNKFVVEIEDGESSILNFEYFYINLLFIIYQMKHQTWISFFDFSVYIWKEHSVLLSTRKLFWM